MQEIVRGKVWKDSEKDAPELCPCVVMSTLLCSCKMGKIINWYAFIPQCD